MIDVNDLKTVLALKFSPIKEISNATTAGARPVETITTAETKRKNRNSTKSQEKLSNGSKNSRKMQCERRIKSYETQK